MKLILTFIALLAINFNITAQPVKVMLITGGHSYDTLQFLQMFDSFTGLEYTHFNQPQANQELVNGLAEKFDVLVFYDMWKTISEQEKASYINLTKRGKPFLFLHHTLVSYQTWPEFQKILGGRYVDNPDLPDEQQSTYKHDVWIDIEITDNKHPATRGMKNFRLFDEVYGNFRVLPDVKPLLKTNHPGSTPLIGWENLYNSSSIIYLQPGHDKNAFESDAYRRLILESIKYLASRP